MSFESYSDQIKQQSLGRNCASGLTSLRSVIDSVENAVSAETKTALMLLSNQPSEDPMWSFTESLVSDTSSGIGSNIIDPITGAAADSYGVLVNTILDPTNIVDAATLTVTAMLGSTAGSVGAFDPEAKKLLVSKTLERAKGACGSTISSQELLSNSWGGLQQAWGKLSQTAKEEQQKIKAFFAASGKTNASGDGLGFGDGLRTITGGFLKVVLGNELSTLKQIAQTIEKLSDTVAKLTAEDYATNHPYLIALVRQHIWAADANLASVNALLLQGSSFDDATYEAAKSELEGAASVLKGDYWDDLLKIFPTARMLRVIALMVELEVLIETFDKLSTDNRSHTKNFFEFKTNFRVKTPGVDVLYGPIISAIRCRLQGMTEDMSQTLAKDQLLTYLLKEKQWYAELQLTLLLFNGMKYFDQFKKALKSSGIGVDKLNFKVDIDEQSLSTSYTGTLSKETLVAEMNKYVFYVKRKVNHNVPNSLVVGYGDVVLADVALYIRERPAFHGSLFVETFGTYLPKNAKNLISSIANNPVEDALNKLNTFAGPGIIAAQAYINALSASNTDLSVDALMRGDFDQFFRFDSVVNSLTQKLQETAALVIDCLESKEPPDPTSLAAAKSAYKVAQEQARASAIYRDVVYNGAEKQLQAIILGDLTKYQ